LSINYSMWTLSSTDFCLLVPFCCSLLEESFCHVLDFCFLNAFQHLLKLSTFGRFLFVLDFFLHMFVAIFGNIADHLLLHLNCFTGIRLICFFFGWLQATSQHLLSGSKLSLIYASVRAVFLNL